MRWWVVVALVALAAGASAQDRVEPGRGTFLVSKGIDDGPFEESVVLLLRHDDQGTLGLIVNRPTGVPLSEALPDLDFGDTSPTLYLGGPVGLEGLLVLFKSKAPPPGAVEVMENVYFSGERAVLEGLLSGDLPSDELRLFVGHAGWAAGQLGAELRRNAWNVVRADLFTLFRTDPDWMWETLTHGRSLARALIGWSARPWAPSPSPAGPGWRPRPTPAT